MPPHRWSVLLAMANKFDAETIQGVLRSVGVTRAVSVRDLDEAYKRADTAALNVIILSEDCAPTPALDWVKMMRRDTRHQAREAAIFVTSRTLTLSKVEACRRAGANAMIGLPITSNSLINTITKVLARPRPFIETEIYTGPCRRAGIVTAGTGARRRRSDAAS